MKRALLLGVCFLLGLGAVRAASAQTVVASTNPDRRGSGDLSVSVQNYYHRVNGRAASNVQGAAVSLRHFFPRTGLFSMQLEPVANGGTFTLGENYLQWSGLPWFNRHWDLAAGDFRSPTAMVENPLPNLAHPELSLRGARATARTEHWTFSVYGGAETLSQGYRVPYRTRVPQTSLGGEAIASVAHHVDLGFRYLHLASPESKVAEQRLFFPANRQFTQSDAFTTQANVRFSELLQWYTEAGWSRVERPPDGQGPRPEFSIATGAALQTARVAARANYFNQGAGYLPLLGYYLGDRRGVNLDGAWYLGRLSLSGNWTQARNNREHNPAVPDYFSRQGGGGFQVRLPATFFVSGSVSRLHFESRSAESGLINNDNRQFQITVSRSLYRHNLHATWQRFDNQIRDADQTIEFLEFEDNYTWRRFSTGGAVRWQRVSADHPRQSLFLRASGQYQTRRLSLYGYWEQGKDLANETLFSTQVSSTSVVGMTWQAPGALTVRMEAFRNHLNTVLNSESLFVLGNRGVAPDGILNRSDDWSLFLRVSRELSWGEPWTLGGGLRQPEAPLTGTLAGYVRMQTQDGPQGAGDVWLLTDTGQAVKTDASGFFQVLEVPQGTRKLRLDMDRLPADYNPPEEHELSVAVRSSQLSRVDMQVTPLVGIEGAVISGDNQPAPEGIVIRLLPQDDYTTTDTSGRFGFYNLPEGDYEIELSEPSLPENARLVTPVSFPASLRYGQAQPPFEFRYEIVLPGPKPLRKVFVQGQTTPLPSSATPTGSKAGKRRVIIRAAAQSRSASSAARNSPLKPTAKWVAR